MSSPERPAPPVECDCPADARIAGYFDRRSRQRRRSGERYQPGPVSQRLRDALLVLDPKGRTVLELGCGPGELLVALLQAGAARATGIDLAAEAIGEARASAEASGVGDRATFAVGDGARLPLEVHDWVVLDKVLCCYPDVAGLLRNSISAARQVYAFAVPVSYGWRGAVAKAALGLEAVVLRLLGRPCPAYVHDVAMIEHQLGAVGFQPAARTVHSYWHIAVFAR